MLFHLSSADVFNTMSEYPSIAARKTRNRRYTMKTLKLFLFTVLLLGLSVVQASVASATADVVYTGSEQVFGTGFGTLDNLLVMQINPPAINETGAVFPTNQTSGDATNQSETYSFQQLISLGITSGANLLLAYNNNETGAHPDTNLISFHLDVYNTSGTNVASTVGL